MARKRNKRSNGKRGITIPVAVVAGFAVPTRYVSYKFSTEGWRGSLKELTKIFTGLGDDGKWYPQEMAKGTLPVILGLTVHKVMSALGVNRMLAQSGIPIIRV